MRVIFTMGGKFFVAAAFQICYLVMGEVYPTLIRSTGQSTGTIMGRFGSITAPYVADLLVQTNIFVVCYENIDGYHSLVFYNIFRSDNSLSRPALSNIWNSIDFRSWRGLAFT